MPRKRLLDLTHMKLLRATPARLAATGLLTIGLSGGVATVSGPAAQAAPASSTVSSVASVSTGLSTAQRRSVVRIASSKRGTPYRWGATGPNRFDCSGFTKWSFKRVGKNIPRTAHQQYRASKKIRRSQLRPGDLVFAGGARKYHVGIYAGNGKMWHSPRRGDVVKLSRIYGNAFGRVR